MDQEKQARIATAQKAAEERRKRALTALAFCYSRCQVMNVHHDALIVEMIYRGGIDAFNASPERKARFHTYIAFWFASLVSVIERYQELTRKGIIPNDTALDKLLTTERIDLIKPFRNAVSHCSDHDDERVMKLLEEAQTLPDWAGEVGRQFRRYLTESGIASD